MTIVRQLSDHCPTQFVPITAALTERNWSLCNRMRVDTASQVTFIKHNIMLEHGHLFQSTRVDKPVEETNLVIISRQRQSKKENGGSKRGPIWDHYDEVTTNANRQLVMRCRECSKEFKHPSSASTLMYHWKNLHWDKQQPANKLGNCEGDDYPKTKKSRMQDALTDVLAIPAYSINTLLHPLVRKFCSVMNPKVDVSLSACFLISLILFLKVMLLSKCSTVQKAIKKTLEGIRSKPSITCDCWTGGIAATRETESSAIKEDSVLDRLQGEIDQEENKSVRKKKEFIQELKHG
uniref:BED-type domain-containing protein n=1 Tax=Ditylenchus dipsaci TaxID=166011 RepID=A0A915E6R0_9BILA